jgi:hypothetical protein
LTQRGKKSFLPPGAELKVSAVKCENENARRWKNSGLGFTGRGCV